MIVSPMNLKTQKLLKNRTLNFDTTKRNYGNMVIVGTDDKKELYATINSKLLRPQQMLSVYSPRIIRPMRRQIIRYELAELFKEMKDNTNGRIQFCKPGLNLYNGRNLTYDITNEYRETAELVSKVKPGKPGIDYMRNYLTDSLNKHVTDAGYERNYLIFPLINFIPDLRKNVIQPSTKSTKPLVLFLKELRAASTGDGDILKYQVFDRIFFYNPNADVMIVFNPNDPEELKTFPDVFLKIIRLNNFNDPTSDETLEDAETEDPDLTEEDYAETLKEQIKEKLFKKLAKQLKINNLSDFEESTKEEKEIILAIDRKLDEYLSDPEKVKQPLQTLIDEVDSDPNIKSKAIKYLETKRISKVRELTMGKNLETELRVIDKVSDIVDDEELLEPLKIETKEKIPEKMQKTTLIPLDREYNTRVLRKDINDIVESFSNGAFHPTTVDSIEYIDSSDDFNEKETLQVKLKTDENQALSFKIDIPKIVDDHYIYLGGNKYTISKQLLRLPIVKTKADRVEITTSYNKMTIERAGSNVSRRNAYLLKLLKGYDNPDVKVLYGDNSSVNSKYPSDFEYEELASTLSKIESVKIIVDFNREVMEDKIQVMNVPEGFITKDRTPLAYEKDSDSALYFIENEKVYKGDYSDGTYQITQVSESMFEFITKNVLFIRSAVLPSIGKAFVYSKVKFLTVVYPIFTLCGLMNGMTDILKKHKVKYQLSDKKLNMGSGWVEVRFKNKYMYYENIMQNTLLLNILPMMSAEEYDIEDFDTDVPYMDYLVDKLGQPMYTKNTLLINLDKMIDPITADILVKTKCPTNIIDLLLLANNMLVNNSYTSLNDISNYRIRGNEIIPACLYGLLSTAMKNFQNYKFNGQAKNLVIGQNELISTLISLPNINTTSVLNPILEIDNAYGCSGKGWKGINLKKAYTLEMRSYDDSMIGYLSGNGTAFSGSSGITRTLVYNPDISDVRGFIKERDNKNITAADLLSIGEMCSPFTAAQADAPRIAMQVSQTKHTMPVAVMNKQLFGSGANKTLAWMISDDFCFKAKKDGVVEEIDKVNKVAILKYTDGTRDAVDLHEVMVRNSSSGFYVKQTFLMPYKEGESFKKDDVIAYNPSFFTGKGKDIDYCSGTLAKVAITAGDFAFEDATIISETLSDKCAANVTVCKSVSIDVNTIIHKIANIGDHIESGDTLLEFTSNQDAVSADILQGLYDTLGDEDFDAISKEVVRSKNTGEIVDIKIYYNRPFEELSPSLQNLITNYKNMILKRKEKLQKLGIKTSSIKLPSTDMQTNKKIEGTEYDGVLINFYIEHLDRVGIGDKITYSTALKGVVSKVLPKDESPVSEYRSEEVVEGILTPTGIISRMCLDIYSIAYINKVLIELGKQIKEIWES